MAVIAVSKCNETIVSIDCGIEIAVRFQCASHLHLQIMRKFDIMKIERKQMERKDLRKLSVRR